MVVYTHTEIWTCDSHTGIYQHNIKHTAIFWTMNQLIREGNVY